ncbi:hypothetical protein BG005_011282 [Podila minutissima]|nr:hypothetical protein BG005_011282 [Podila minutissima]
MVRFHLIDTPGLNDTKGADEQHVQKIFHALNKAKTIHLILITISTAPFTQGLQDAIRAYVDMFPGFNGIIAFVHTSVFYKTLHPECVDEDKVIRRKNERLYEIMGRKNFPYFKIDCDVYTVFNRPIDVLQSVVHKTRKMRDIDNILTDKYQATSETIQKTLQFKNLEEGRMVKCIFRLETQVQKLEAGIKVLDEFLARHAVDLPEILYEERYDTNNENSSEGVMSMHYENRDVNIEYRSLLSQNVKILEEKSLSESSKSWHIKFVRTSAQHSIVHVKIYTLKSNIYHKEIEAKKKERRQLRAQLVDAKQSLSKYVTSHKKEMESIKEIIENHAGGIGVLAFATNDVLQFEVFSELIEAKAYMGDTSVSAKNVAKVYSRLSALAPV